MTQTIEVPTDSMKDFTTEQKPVKFNIDKADGTKDIFEGISDLPALLLVEFAGMTETLSQSSISDQPKVFKTLFELVLTEDSAARFIGRMKDKKNPISLTQITEIMPWIMEQYGMRPTQPSSNSSAGSESQDGGTSLTENAPQPALTSVPSPASDSST